MRAKGRDHPLPEAELPLDGIDKPDRVLFVATLLLVGLGIVIVYSASVAVAEQAELRGTVAIPISAKLEAEITELDPEEGCALLKEKGYEVTGVTMKIWDGEECTKSKPSSHACYGPGEWEDIEDAKKVAEHLGFPLSVLDLTKEYRDIVLDYVTDEYLSGKTPNPCVLCNRMVKLSVLLDKASDAGVKFDYVATGHYVRSKFDKEKDRHLLLKAKDTVSPSLLGGYDKIGFRFPDHPITKAIIDRFGPITATSANLHGASEPVTIFYAVEQFGDNVDIYLDTGSCKFGKPSTVIDTTGNTIKIIRHGACSGSELDECLRGS